MKFSLGRITFKTYMPIVLSIVMIGILLAVGMYMITVLENTTDCSEKINVCSYQYSYGRGTRTEYVSCKDTRAERIQQMCITNAPGPALLDFYNENKKE